MKRFSSVGRNPDRNATIVDAIINFDCAVCSVTYSFLDKSRRMDPKSVTFTENKLTDFDIIFFLLCGIPCHAMTVLLILLRE